MATGLEPLTSPNWERKMTTGLKTLTSPKTGEEDGYRAEDTSKH